MTTNPMRTWAQRHQRTKEQERRAWQARQVGHAQQLSQLSDEELIGRAPGFPGPHHEMEMNRRLKMTIEKLTTELVAFRESSDQAARKLGRLTNILIGFTAALVALTVALVILTVIVAATG
jgi:hypothetical protein